MSIGTLQQNNLGTCWSQLRDEAPLDKRTVMLTLLVLTLHPPFFFFLLSGGLKRKRVSFTPSGEPEALKKSPADALPCGPYPHPCSVHIHECVCTGIYECEDGPFLPLKMTHKTGVLATYALKAAWGMPFQHSRTSG